MRKDQVSPGDIIVVTRGYSTGVHAIISSDPWVKMHDYRGSKIIPFQKGMRTGYGHTKGFLAVAVENARNAHEASASPFDRTKLIEKASAEAKRLARRDDLAEIIADGTVTLNKSLRITVIVPASATHTFDEYNALAEENSKRYQAERIEREERGASVEKSMVSIAHSLHALDSDLDIRQKYGRVDYSNTDIHELARLLEIAASTAR